MTIRPDILANPDWWRGAVIYQIYPRSFQDSNGDGVGDLPGITARLEHIAGLGVDAIWISPIQKSPMKDFGYDVSDYDDVDPVFGTLGDFDTLITKAHSLGLKVIIDQVLSHTSDKHPWFQESRSDRSNPKADWYVWADPLPDGSPPNNWRSVFGGSSWQWDSRRKQYYLHNFLAEQPDLNYHHPAVQDAALASVRFWLERGLDGFRFDTTNYFHHDPLLRNNPALQRRWTPENLPANPYEMQQHLYDKNRPENVAWFEKVRQLLDLYGATSVGEVGDAEALDLMIAYTAGGKRLHMTYSFAFLNQDNSATQVRRHTEAFDRAAQSSGSWPCWTLGNHDAVRVLTRWGGAGAPADFTRLVMAMLFSLRGSVCWYQGDELALPEAELAFEDLVDPPGIALWPEYKGRDGCRTPLPWQRHAPHAGFSPSGTARTWLPIPPGHVERSLDQAENNPNAPLHFMRAFLRWRQKQPELLRGEAVHHGQSREVLVFERRLQGHHTGLLCAFNLSDKPISVLLPTLPTRCTKVNIPGLPDHQLGACADHRLELPGYGVYIGSFGPA